MRRAVEDLEYRVIQSGDRRTADIVIERDGELVIRIPANLSLSKADDLVQRKKYWIYKNLAEWRDLNSTRVVRQWLNGESYPYLGRHYRLRLISNQEADLLLKGGCFCLKRQLVEQDEGTAARQAFEDFFTYKGIERISARVNYFAPLAKVSPGSIKVLDLGYRWASCTSSFNLRFHWKCMMAPASVIDYIVVHELCHIHHRNHTDSFWNEVDKVMPNYRSKREWLKKNGAGLDL